MAGNEPKTTTEAKPPAVKTFACPSCGAPVTIRAIGQTITVACGSCAAIIDSSNENYQVLQKAKKQEKVQPLIPLGKRGKIHGVLWEVIGYIEKSDIQRGFLWSEYLLFNPSKGFRWLTNSGGHWNYVIGIKHIPEADTDLGDRTMAKYLNKKYYLFHRGGARTEYVIGEFYWQVKVGERIGVEDYVNAPEVLSCERTKTEITWSIGEYIKAADVYQAFDINQPLPAPDFVAPNQPSAATEVAKYSNIYWSLFLGIILIIQIFSMITSKSKIVFQEQFMYDPAEIEKTKATPSFDLNYGMSNVEITLAAKVQNSWMEVQGDLINDVDGESDEFEQGVEYYSGYDSDGAWAEGSITNSIILSSVPAGTYHLNLQATNGSMTPLPYTITVKRDVWTWTNFLWAIGLISLFPLFIWWRSRAFEIERWSQSDFSPYQSHYGDDE